MDLKGHLLLANGMMDGNVPPYNTLLVMDALIKRFPVEYGKPGTDQ